MLTILLVTLLSIATEVPAPAAVSKAEAHEERTPFETAEVRAAYTIDSSGGVIDCGLSHKGHLYETDNDFCDGFRDADMLAAMLGQPLAGLSEVDVHVAFAPGGMIESAADQRTVARTLAAARLEVAPAGTITQCVVTASTKFAGLSIDLCDMLKSQNVNSFTRAAAGQAIRKADVLLEVVGFGGHETSVKP